MIPLMSPRGCSALELRPKAIAVVQKHGSLEKVGTMRCLAAKALGSRDHVSHSFQKVPRAPDAMRYGLALEGRCADFGFGIDVWWHKPFTASALLTTLRLVMDRDRTL
jgi:hypothetical protein